MTRNTVVHPVVFALVAFAAWAFLPVCFEIWFRLLVVTGREKILEHAVDIICVQHFLMSLLIPLKCTDAVDQCLAESPWPDLGF